MHSCDDTPYITLMQIPLDISQTLTVLSIEDDAMYWLLEEKSKSVTSFECPANCLMTEGGSETVHTVKVPSAAPYASRLELACPNFRTVTEALL